MSQIAGAIEALLLMATEPVPAPDLAEAVDAPVPEVEDCLAELAAFYDESGRGFELRRVGSGWRYYTREEHADVIGRWLLEGQRGTLSQAALETLAVVAYLQPISRGRVSAVRGVNVDGVMRTLATRDLIEEVSRDEETGARLFGTTSYFLERMGLTSLDQLPPLAPHLPDAAALEAELAGLAGHGTDEPLPIAADEDAHRRPGEGRDRLSPAGNATGIPGQARDDVISPHRRPGEGRDPLSPAGNATTGIPGQARDDVISPHRHPGERRDPLSPAGNATTGIPGQARDDESDVREDDGEAWADGGDVTGEQQ